MKNAIRNLALVVSVSSLVSACGAAWNGANDTLSVTDRHPIAVDSQVVTLTIDVDPSVNEIRDIDRARLNAFANAYLVKGHGPITVTAPSGGRDDLVAQELAADVRQLLNDGGVSYEQMTGASYLANGAGNERQVVLSYTSYVATPSPCGVWTSEIKNRYKNLPHPNFGCADQNNLAAMIADPRDLIVPADEAPADATARVRAIEAYREGEVTASERDGDIETDIAN